MALIETPPNLSPRKMERLLTSQLCSYARGQFCLCCFIFSVRAASDRDSSQVSAHKLSMQWYAASLRQRDAGARGEFCPPSQHLYTQALALPSLRPHGTVHACASPPPCPVAGLSRGTRSCDHLGGSACENLWPVSKLLHFGTGREGAAPG